MKSDFSKVKVGDKIWTIQSGWVEVDYIDKNSFYPILSSELSYTLDGKNGLADKYPSAFLEYPFKEEPIKKDTLVWYRNAEGMSWMVGYYSHFEDGQHFCFVASKKSTETDALASWNIVTTENPLI